MNLNDIEKRVKALEEQAEQPRRIFTIDRLHQDGQQIRYDGTILTQAEYDAMVRPGDLTIIIEAHE